MDEHIGRARQPARQPADGQRLGFSRSARQWSETLKTVEQNWALWAALMLLAVLVGSAL